DLQTKRKCPMRRRRTYALLFALIGVAAAGYFEPTHCVRGWLWGEAFFDGRPTSYWRGVIERDLQVDRAPLPPSRWQRAMDGLGYRPRVIRSIRLIEDQSAEPVLRQLQGDGNANI